MLEADVDAFELAAKLESLLPRLMRYLYRPMDEDPLSDLPLAQTRILRLLYSGHRTVTSLGDELGLTASAVTQMVNRLQEAGMVERAEDPEDRRVKNLALTKRSMELMKARQERRIARAHIALQRLTQERRVAVTEAIEELIAAGGEMPRSESLSVIAEIEQAMPLAPPYKK